MSVNYKKAILVVSSGTTNEKARRENIEAIERKISEEFNEYEVRRAFTSQKIIDRLRDEGIYINTPQQALEELMLEAFNEVIIQPLHIIAGTEYKRIVTASEKLKGCFHKLITGSPLLYNEKSYEDTSRILDQEFSKLSDNEAVVFMGHGGRGEGNDSYSILQRAIDKRNLNIFVGTINAEPSLQSIINKLKAQKIEEVILMPFMIVAGNHALVDMASDTKNSWKSMLEEQGFKTRLHMHGLGEKEQYQRLYVQRIREALER